MKVIANVQDGKFLCEVTNAELQRFFNTYYNYENQKGMRIGKVYNLAEGYDFAQDAIDAMQQTNDFIGANKKIIETIIKGISIIEKAKKEIE